MLILKIYDNSFSTTPIKQIFELLEVSIEQNINGVSSAEVRIPIEDGFRQYQKAEIYEVNNGQDSLLFSGYILQPQPSLRDFRLELRGQDSLMKRKGVLSDKSYTSETPSTILNDIIGDWNTAYSESWSIQSSVTDTITVDFKQGDSVYSVLTTLSEQLGYNWTVKNQVILFDEIVGEDKSSGSNFAELVYNGINHIEDNISDINLETYGNLSNVIIGSDGSSKTIKSDATSISSREALYEYKTFDTSDLDTSTQEYLDFKKDDLFNYIIDTEPFGPDVNLGDKIKLRVEEASEYLNIDSEVIISQVQIDYTNATLVKRIGVQTKVVKNNFLSNRLEDIESQLLLLSL